MGPVEGLYNKPVDRESESMTIDAIITYEGRKNHLQYRNLNP